MTEPVLTTCKKCNRLIEAAHLDRDGYCCDCTTMPAPAAPPAASDAPHTPSEQELIDVHRPEDER